MVRIRCDAKRGPRLCLVLCDDAVAVTVQPAADSSSLEALLPEYSGAYICGGQ